MALVTITRLGKSYRRGPESIEALRDVSLELSPGEVVALVGRSGSGKTTLLNIIAGWEEPTSGSVTWRSGGEVPTRWENVAVVPQRLGLLEELTVRENVELPFLKTRDVPSARVEMLLADLGLDALADRYPLEVSIGEQQRTAVARALVARPNLILLDEPTGHQDPDSAGRLMRRVLDEARRGVGCLIATHSARAGDFADRVVAIDDGRLVPA